MMTQALDREENAAATAHYYIHQWLRGVGYVELVGVGSGVEIGSLAPIGARAQGVARRR